MSSVVASFRGRLHGRHESYVVCPQDGFLFRPLYTGGTCPLCGAEAQDGEERLPLLLRFDRFRLGLLLLGLVSIGMTALVLALFFR